MLVFSFPYLVARQIDWVIFLLRFAQSLIPVLIFFLYLKDYLRCIEPLGKKPDELLLTSLFLGYNRQHQLVCAKTISSWVRKVLCVAKHMSLGSFCGAAGSATLAGGISLVSILQAGDWTRVSMSARPYFFTYFTTVDWHQDSVQHGVLGLSENVHSL